MTKFVAEFNSVDTKKMNVTLSGAPGSETLLKNLAKTIKVGNVKIDIKEDFKPADTKKAINFAVTVVAIK